MWFHATSLAGAVALFMLATSQCQPADAKGPASWFGKSHQPIQVRECDDKIALNLEKEASSILHASISGPSDIPAASTSTPLDISTAACPVDLEGSSSCPNPMIPTHHHHHEQKYINSHTASQFVEMSYPTPVHETNVGHEAHSSSHTSSTGISVEPTTTPAKAEAISVAGTGKETMATMLNAPRSADEPYFRYGVMDHIQRRFGQVVDSLKALAPHQDDEIMLHGEDEEYDDDAVEGFDEDFVAKGIKKIKKRDENDHKDVDGHQNSKGGSSSAPSPSSASGNRDALPMLDRIKKGVPDILDFDRHKDDVHFDDVGKIVDLDDDDEITFGILPVVDKLKRGLSKGWDFWHHKDHQESDRVGKGEQDVPASAAHAQKVYDSSEKYTAHITDNIGGESILARILSYVPRKIHRDASLHLKTETQNFVSQKERDLKNAAYGHLQQQKEDLKHMAADKIAHAQQGIKDYAHEKQQEAAQRRAEEEALKKRQDQEALEARAKEKKAAEEDAKRFEAEHAAAVKAEARLQKQREQLLAQEKKETEKFEAAQKEAAKKAAKAEAAILEKRRAELAAIDKKAAATRASLEAMIATEAKAHEALQDAENKKHEAVIRVTQEKIITEEKATAAKRLAAEKTAMAKLKKRQEQDEKAAKKEVKKNEAEAKKRMDKLKKCEAELEDARRAKVVAERMAREARAKAERL